MLANSMFKRVLFITCPPGIKTADLSRFTLISVTITNIFHFKLRAMSTLLFFFIFFVLNQKIWLSAQFLTHVEVVSQSRPNCVSGFFCCVR